MTVLNKTIGKFVRRGSLGALALLAAQAVSAGPVDPLLDAGIQIIDDKSGEVVFRCVDDVAGTTCTRLSIGDPLSPAVGNQYDVFAGTLDFSSVNGVFTNTVGQLTALFAVRLDSISDNDSNPATLLNEVANFVPAGQAAFEAIFGAASLGNVANSEGGTPDDVVAVLYQHNASVLNAEMTNTPANPAGDAADLAFDDSVAAAQLGTFAAALGILGDDFLEGEIRDVRAVLVGGGAAPNSTVLYLLRAALSFLDYELSGDFVPDAMLIEHFPGAGGAAVMADLVFDGSLQPTNAFDVVEGDPEDFQFANNIQASFTRVPEPASLGLLGLGVFGLAGLAARRRRSRA